MKHADVTVSIITHSALAEAARCLKAVLATRYGARLVLTANGNPAVTDYFKWIAANFSDVEVIVNLTNQGFIEPNCRAFSRCDTEFFCMLNDDAIPPDNWISLLKSPFINDPKMAIVGAKGGCTTLDENFVGHRGNQLDYCEASCILVKRSLMPNPLFDKSLFFAYAEDAFLSLEVRERGFHIAQADFFIEHNRNTTSRKIPRIREIMQRNFATCRKRWGYYLKHRKFENNAA